MSTRSETKSETNEQAPAASDLATLTAVDPAVLDTLHGRLVDDAADADLLDVAYRTVDAPVGRLLLAATPRGLVRVAFEREGFDAVLTALAARVSPRVLRSGRRLDDAARQLEEYFAGRRTAFELPLDHSLSSGFRGVVQRFLPSIGYGRTLTYQQVAEQVGSPKAVRAVGSACATNPLPVVVPCHRVLRTGGGLGGYLGGTEAKTSLLQLEQAA